MLKWEKLNTEHADHMRVHRAKVPGGWLVSINGYEAAGLTFYPDPNHTWTGKSLP